MSSKTLNQKTSMASHHNRMDAEIENPNISSGLATLKKTINNTREDSVLKNQTFGDGIVLEVSSEMIEYNFFGMNARKEDASSKKLKGYLCKIMPHYDVLPSPSDTISDPVKDREKYLEMCHLYSTYAPLSDATRAPRMGEPIKIIKQNGLIGSNGEQIDGFYEVLTPENSFFDETDDLLNSLRDVYDKIKNYFGFSQETGKVQDLQQGDTGTSSETNSGPSGGSIWTPEGEFEPDWPSPIVDSFYSVPRYGIKEKAQNRLRKDPLKTAVVLHFTDGRHEGSGTSAGAWLGWRGSKVGYETFKKNNNTTYSDLDSSVAVHYYVAGDGQVRQTVKEKYQTDHDNNGKNSIGIEIHGAFSTILKSKDVASHELGEDTKGKSEGLIIRRFPVLSKDSDAQSLSLGNISLVDKRDAIEKKMLSDPDPGNSLNLADMSPKKLPMQKGSNSFVNPYFMDPFWPWNENTKFNKKMQKLVTLVYCLCKRYQIPMTSDSIFVKITDHLRSGYHAGNGSKRLHIDVSSYFWWKLFLKALQNFDESKLPEAARTAFTAGTETPKDAIDETIQVSLQEYCLENSEDPVCADVKSTEETPS